MHDGANFQLALSSQLQAYQSILFVSMVVLRNVNPVRELQCDFCGGRLGQ